MSEPKADRPHMPGYGIATARSNGQPHVMPVWGVWIDGAFYFSTGTRSRKARNLVENPRCAISCEVGEDQLIIEGQAQLVDDPEMRRRFGSAYQTKYDFDMEGFNEPFYSVQ